MTYLFILHKKITDFLSDYKTKNFLFMIVKN